MCKYTVCVRVFAGEGASARDVGQASCAYQGTTLCTRGPRANVGQQSRPDLIGHPHVNRSILLPSRMQITR